MLELSEQFAAIDVYSVSVYTMYRLNMPGIWQRILLSIAKFSQLMNFIIWTSKAELRKMNFIGIFWYYQIAYLSDSIFSRHLWSFLSLSKRDSKEVLTKLSDLFNQIPRSLNFRDDKNSDDDRKLWRIKSH